MTETDELLDRLEAFQKGWPRKKNSVLSQAGRQKESGLFCCDPQRQFASGRREGQL